MWFIFRMLYLMRFLNLGLRFLIPPPPHTHTKLLTFIQTTLPLIAHSAAILNGDSVHEYHDATYFRPL